MHAFLRILRLPDPKSWSGTEDRTILAALYFKKLKNANKIANTNKTCKYAGCSRIKKRAAIRIAAPLCKTCFQAQSGFWMRTSRTMPAMSSVALQNCLRVLRVAPYVSNCSGVRPPSL